MELWIMRYNLYFFHLISDLISLDDDVLVNRTPRAFSESFGQAGLLQRGAVLFCTRIRTRTRTQPAQVAGWASRKLMRPLTSILRLPQVGNQYVDQRAQLWAMDRMIKRELCAELVLYVRERYDIPTCQPACTAVFVSVLEYGGVRGSDMMNKDTAKPTMLKDYIFKYFLRFGNSILEL